MIKMLASALVLYAAFVEPAPAQDRHIITERHRQVIRIGDLNPNLASDRATMLNRVEMAIRQGCALTEVRRHRAACFDRMFERTMASMTPRIHQALALALTERDGPQLAGR